MKKEEAIKAFSEFKKIVTWLFKPKWFKNPMRTQEWSGFNPEKDIEFETFPDNITRLDAILHRGYRGEILDRVCVDYTPRLINAYGIYVYFWGARSYYGDVVTVEDELYESTEEDALRTIQKLCYRYMG